MEKMSLPPEWGTDSLTKFMEESYLHRLTSFEKMKEWFQTLIRVDSWFVRVRDGGRQLSPIIPATLLVRSHSAYRAACEHAAAGQMVEAFVLNRACLECAGYALHIYKNPKSGETWLWGVTDPEAAGAEKKAATDELKEEFKIKKIKSTIEKTNPRIGKNFVELYAMTIEFGAHPNPQSVMSSLVASADNTGFSLTTRHDGDTAHSFALVSTELSGFCALEILQEAFRERFEHSGVSADLRKASGRPDHR